MGRHVLREHLIAKVKTLGYRYKRETERVTLWVKSGVPQPIPIQKRKQFHEETVRSILGQAGCDRDEVEKFIGDASICCAR